MLDRGDWVVPIFNGQIFPEKPPLMFWTMIAGYKAFGVNEFGARIGSAVLGMLTALATYHLGRRLFSPRVGLWGGLIVSTNMIFTVSARAATVDCALCLATLLAMYFFASGELEKLFRQENLDGDGHGQPQSRSGSWLRFVLLWAMLGIAVLGKGPIGLLLPAGSIGLFLMVMNCQQQPPIGNPRDGQNRWLRSLAHVARAASPVNFLRSLWQMRPLTGLVVVAIVALPWYVLVDARTHGVWTEQFLARFNLRPFTQPFLGHSGPFWYHVPVILIGLFPWSVFLGPALSDWTRQIREHHPWRPGYVLLACWSAVFFVFWSISKTKLPHYLLPIYPAIALATGAFLDRWIADSAVFGRKQVWTAFGITIGVGFGFLGVFPVIAQHVLPGEGWLGVVGLILIAGGAASLYLVKHERRLAGLTVFAAMATVWITAVFGFTLLRIDAYQNARPMIARIRADADGDSRLASYAFLEKSYVFYAGKPIAWYSDAEALRQYLGVSRGYVFCDQPRADDLLRRYPDEFEVLVRQRRFLRNEHVLVLLHREQARSNRIASQPHSGSR